MFAVVAVNAPVFGGGTAYNSPSRAGTDSSFPGPVFHYHIPPQLESQVLPGVLIVVPFGSRQVQGVVIGLSDATPVSETKPVTRCLFEEPVLSQAQLELGLWLSEHYFSPLIECLRLMLPPGMLRQPHAILRLHPEVPVPSDLPREQRQVVELLQRYDTLSPSQLTRRIGKAKARRAIRALIRSGIVIRSSALPAPRVRPKRVNFVRLTASPPQIAAVRPFLGHPSKQAEILRALLREEDPLPSVDRILALAEASRSTLSTLVQKGWIEIELERNYITPLAAADAADLGRAPKQRAVIAYLHEQPAPVEEQFLRETADASRGVIRTLRERGLVQEIHQPAAVLLLLDDAEAHRRAIEMRGAERQHGVLDLLLSRPAGEWLWVSWIYAETGCTLHDLHALESYGVIELAEREVWRDSLSDRSFVLETPPKLTPDQERAWAMIEPAIREANVERATEPPQQPPTMDGVQAFLIHGVTGSGKTEIYMRAVEKVLQQGRQAIVLVPEISLTPQTVRRFAARFPDGLGVIHSGLSDGERYDTWRRVRAGQVRLVVGPRSALFAPMDNVGLIVIDEEHASSYKESERLPPYHTREVALRIAAAQEAVVVLGSATPDLTTYHAACETDAVQLLELPQRILEHRRYLEDEQARRGIVGIKYRPLGPEFEELCAIDLPRVQVVDMRHELRTGNRSIFSRLLQREMRAAFASGEQIILFLNRRGATTFVMCRDCGTAIHCPRCDVPLTYHLKGKKLTCHHCSFQRTVPSVCPVCESHRIKHFGVGTQQVEMLVHQFLPEARTLRWDRDTTREKGSHAALLERFVAHQADVLIGTQVIAKGLDLPLVTLVGVISADTALRLPDFRASERTFQLLTQVAGRAGRGPRGGQVVVQTYTPEHYAIQAAAQHDYGAFYAQERAFRLQMGYPPFSQLARLVRSDSELVRCRQEAHDLATALEKAIQQHHLEGLALLGPAPCFFSRLRGQWRWQIIVQSTQTGGALRALFDQVDLPAGWRLDVDPLDIL